MDITKIEFGFLSPAAIMARSVCEVKHVTKPSKTNPLENTLSDPRMGPIEDGVKCVTCTKEVAECPGHFGHIVLTEHIIYPTTYGFKTVLNFLKCFCFRCSRLIFSEEKLKLLDLNISDKTQRYRKIVDASEKVEICWSCSAQVAKFYIVSPNQDPKLMMYYKMFSEKKNKETSIEVNVSEIERVFQKIPDGDVSMFGFNPRKFRPEYLILSIIPVIPPVARPNVTIDGKTCEDDLTNIYKEICKADNKIANSDVKPSKPSKSRASEKGLKEDTPEEIKQKELRKLIFHLSVLYNNSKGRSRHSTGRTKKGMTERLSGKKGLFRGNLGAKRVNFAARTVVGGDPTLESDQIGIPRCISEKVTIPEVVTSFNYVRLSELVNQGKATHVVRKDGETRRKHNLGILLHTKPTPLFYGDKVYRVTREKEEVKEPQPGDYQFVYRNKTLESIKIVEGANVKVEDGLEVKYFREIEKEREVKVRESKRLLPGDRVVHKHLGNTEAAAVEVPRHFRLEMGDVVHRHLQDGDWVILNRQPTLHVGSEMACRIKIMPGFRVIKVPLNLTTPYNMDFDGDEANIHVPQTLEAKAEYMDLLSVGSNIISGQASRPIMGVVYDSLLGAFLSTREPWIDIAPDRFFNLCTTARVDTEKFSHITRVYSSYFPELTEKRFQEWLIRNGVEKLSGRDRQVAEERGRLHSSLLFTGRGLFSMVLPKNFTYSLHNKASEVEPIFKIRYGCVVEGTADKNVVGPKGGAIHHYMRKEVALKFLTQLQHLMVGWLTEEGYSLGMQDCIPTKCDTSGCIPEVKELVQGAYRQAQMIEVTQTNPLVAEIKINNILNGARETAQKIARDMLSKENRFIPFCKGGSKGSLINVVQITSLLGQQNIEGKRLELSCLDGKRALPHYDPEEQRENLALKYEERGFVENSLFKQLNPQQFWCHAGSSREGISGTATKTARTGYIQHRMTEMLKDVTVEYDGTVRISGKRIVQFAYGGDGISPKEQHKIEGALQVDIGTAIDEMCIDYELRSYQDCFLAQAEERDREVREQEEKDRAEMSPANSEDESEISVDSAYSGDGDYD
jgi:DNA-directed RNA polymerase beta' subunit